MYFYNLTILIFSTGSRMEKELRKVSPCPQFEHTFSLISSFSDASLQKCKTADIIFIDLPLSQIPMNIAAYCTKKHAKIVYCQDSESAARLPNSSLLRESDEIWIMPLTDALITFYFTNLLTRIKLFEDLWITENYLNTGIDSIPDLIWFKDLRGAHLNVNNSFCDAVGKTKKDCAGRGHYYIWDLKAEEYEKGEYVCLETEEIVLREKKTCLFDECVKSKSGMRQFKTYKSPIFDKNEELIGTVGIAHDVTDLRNLGAELEIILESSNFAGIIVSESGKIMYTNRKFKEYFHEDMELPLGADYFSWKNEMLYLSKTSRTWGNFETDLTLNGVVTFFEITEEPLYSIFDQIIGYFCIYRDITEHKNHLELLSNYQNRLEADVLVKTKALQEIQRQMIIGFADIIESRDRTTGGHIKRTSKYVDIIVNTLKTNSPYAEYINSSFIKHMSLAAPLHDIGKISIPDEVLNKQGKYLPPEYELMKKHASWGGEILNKTISCLEDEEYYILARNMAIYHHERWDGTGYPESLKEIQIPLSARIMAVADVFDALVSKRPYKEPFSLDTAYKIIQNSSGTHFDPIIVDAFAKSWDLIEETVEQLRSE